MKKEDIEAIKFDARIQGIEEERRRIFTIINYILNKNSFSFESGVDYKKVSEEIEELESYLSHN